MEYTSLGFDFTVRDFEDNYELLEGAVEVEVEYRMI